jgi:hypothetical protein
LKFFNQANELHVSESFSFFGFKNKQFPVNLKPVQAFNGSHDKVVGNDIKMNLWSKNKDEYVNSTRSLQGAG